MRVFVTGASGWIGSAVVPELIGAGHQVLGLARSDASAAAVAAAGAEVLRGDLDDLDILRAGAAGPTGSSTSRSSTTSPHRGLGTRPTRAPSRRWAARSRAPVSPWSSPPGRPRVPGRVGDRARRVRARLARGGPDGERQGGSRHGGARGPLVGRGAAADGARRRRPHGFIARLIGIARDKGVSGYVGDGSNRWPAVHVLDAAHLFRLAVEQAPAGSRLHAVGDEGVPIRDIAEVIGRHLNVPTASVSAEDLGFSGAGPLTSTSRRPAR